MDENRIYSPPKGLIISPSGMRGIVSENLDPEVILRFTEAFGMWLKHKLPSSSSSPRILVGMDPRTTGPMIKQVTIGALLSVGAEIIDVDVCPTPPLLYGHKSLKCNGTVIISASHNPPQYNGMKCLGPSGTFLSNEELAEINEYFYGKQPIQYVPWDKFHKVQTYTTLVDDYFTGMKDVIDLDLFSSQKMGGRKPLKVIVDTCVGAGTGVTARFLKELGCDALEINNTLNEDGSYPRMFEPTQAHLDQDTFTEIGCDVAFAHDFDADRVTLIGEKGQIYREDVIVALLWHYLLQKHSSKKMVTVTNCASSLMLDDLAHKYHAEIVHTPVGERYLAEKLNALIDAGNHDIIFGGEGSCGGFMYPKFNNTRDGIFSAVLICEILLKTGKTISQLVEEIPTYYSVRRNIKLSGGSAVDTMNPLKNYLDDNHIKYDVIANDVKVFGETEWTLVHPSNTEPIIRIITDAHTEDRAIELLDGMHKTILGL